MSHDRDTTGTPGEDWGTWAYADTPNHDGLATVHHLDPNRAPAHQATAPVIGTITVYRSGRVTISGRDVTTDDMGRIVKALATAGRAAGAARLANSIRE